MTASMRGAFSPRPHQEQAIAAAVKHLAGASRATVVSACGTGKTLMAAHIARRLAARRVLVALPTIDLLAQTIRAWSQAGHTTRAVAVCSARETARHHPGCRVTTSAAELASLVAGPDPVTLYCTYSSLSVLSAAHLVHRTPAWDLAVVDEAHHTAGLLGKAWGAIHHDDDIPAGRRLYLTATPRIVGSDEHILASMDDDRLYGPTVFRLDTGDAIKAGLLADYQVLVPVVANAALHQRINGAGDPDRGRLTALQVVVLTAAREHQLRRILTCHQRVANARAFAETLPEAGGRLPLEKQPPALWANWISGRHTPTARRRILTDFVADGHRPAVLAHSRVLAEGVDVPTLDAVVFADPKESVIDTVQVIGRALRLPPGTGKRATIIVPIFLSPDEQPEDALDSSAYASLWRTLRALGAHDGRVVGRVGDLRTLRPTGGRLGDGPDTGWLRVTGDINPHVLAAAIHLRVVGRKSAEWRRGYAAARRYHAQHGNLDCSQGHVDEKGVGLGSWLSWQRGQRRIGKLSSGRQQLLEALGIEWEPRVSQWDRSLGYARRYHAQHGHLNPEIDAREGDFPIGRWLRNLRCRATELPLERVAQLQALDPWWNPPWRQSWQRAYRLAAAYRRQHQHLNIPRTCIVRGIHLGEWLHTQRLKRHELSPAQANLLDDLGIVWGKPSAHEEAWRSGLEAARRYHADHGHLEVPQKHVTDHGFRLGAWINNKRRRRRLGRLIPEQVAELDALGMSWTGQKQPGCA